MLSFYRVSWIPVMLFSNTPMSATVLQHHRPNSSQAFLLPPDVLEAAGSCWRCNILHPTHSWFQPVTVSSVFLKEHPPSNWFQWLVVVLFQLLPGFSISRIKHESIEPYDCAVLEQRARTVTSVQVWTVHLGASYFMLCPWVRTQHLGEKKKKKKSSRLCGGFDLQWVHYSSGPGGLGAVRQAGSRRCWMRSCQGHLPAPGSSTGPAPAASRGRAGQVAATAVRKRRKVENQTDQSPRGPQMTPFIPRCLETGKD